jgi:SAM-dependent methyltransferase
MSNEIKPGASHPATNNVIYSLITRNISANSKVLDFGAGQGYMSKKIGDHFKSMPKSPAPREHIFACEIDTDGFKYEEIECVKISPNSEIPFPNETFDLIYAIEVLEHTPRPYDFFLECFAKIKPGGTLLFSTPNILHFKSRFQFLMTGYSEMYGPLSIKNENAGRICGHIMPLSFNNFHYGLSKAGFQNIEFYIDRRKKGALIPAILFYPLLKLATWKTKKATKAYDMSVYKENEHAIEMMNSLDALSSRSCILVARKPN